MEQGIHFSEGGKCEVPVRSPTKEKNPKLGTFPPHHNDKNVNSNNSNGDESPRPAF